MRRFVYRLRRLGFLLGAIVLALFIALVVILRRKGEEVEPEPLVSVETAVAVVKPIVTRIEALGTVQAQPGHIAEISAPETSRVVAIYVSVGDAVRAGQPLVQLDKAVFTANRQGAEVAVASAQHAYDRAQRLLAEGISPRKDVESAATDLAKARADLEQARRTERLATLRSPINGVVVVLNASLSLPVDIGAEVVEVVDPQGLQILFHLGPSDAGRVGPGNKVELTSGQNANKSKLGTGTITGVSAALDTVTGAVSVRATIASPSRLLKVGETLDGVILVPGKRSAVVVPIAALVPEDQETVVFVVTADSIAHATTVTVGTRTETEAEIISGLKGGEVVVTQGAYGVTDSAKVVTGRAK
jgi:cobalt-zinc-cadmium efflux system membrane fusion protein